MIIMLLPDLLTLIPIYLWHNNELHRYHHYAIRVLLGRTLSLVSLTFHPAYFILQLLIKNIITNKNFTQYRILAY